MKSAFLNTLLILFFPSFQFAQTTLEPPELIVQAGHSKVITTLAFSSNDVWLASGSDDRSIKLWNVSTGRLARTLVGPADAIEFLSFAHNDEWLIATDRRSVYRWETATGRELQAFYRSSIPGAVNPVVISPDGRYLAYQVFDGNRVEVWITDVSSNSPPRLQESLQLLLTSIQFSSDSRFMVTTDLVGVTKVWNVETGTVFTLEGSGKRLELVIFGKSNQLLAGAHGKYVELWSGISGQIVGKLKCKQNIKHLAFSPDGKSLIAVGESDSPINIWNFKGAELISESPRETKNPPFHQLPAKQIGFTTDGRLLTGHDDGTLRLWNVVDLNPIRTINAHKARVYVVATGNKTDLIASGSDDLTVKLWYASSGQQLYQLGGGSDQIDGVLFSDSAEYLATVSYERYGRIWPLLSIEQPHYVQQYLGSAKALSFSPHGRIVASGSRAGDIQLWNAANGEEEHRWKAHDDGILALTYNEAGTLLASAGVDKIVKVWRVSDSSQHCALSGHQLPIHTLAFSATGELVSGSWDGTVAVWDPLRCRKIRILRRSSQQWSFPVAIDPVLPFFLAAGELSGEGLPQVAQFIDPTSLQAMEIIQRMDETADVGFEQTGALSIWEKNGKKNGKIGATLQNVGRIGALSFSPDGHLLAVGTNSSSVWVFETSTWERLHVLRQHSAAVTGLSFSANGHWLASSSTDGTVQLWRADTWERAATLIPSEGGTITITPDGLFDGSADTMQQVAWRVGKTNDTIPLDAFFTDFYHPGLLAEIMAGERPKAQVDIASLLQVPGLRSMLANKFVHPEIHDDRIVICFDQKPGAVINVGPNDQRVVFPPLNGYQAGTTPTCKFEKELPQTGTSPAALMEQLKNWKPEVVTTPWDGKSSDTGQSTLHVLTVGISQYPSSSKFDPLPYAVPSAKAIEDFFKQQSVSPQKAYAAVRVWDGMYDTQATRDNLRQRWVEMAKAVGRDDVVLLYMAGHGKVSPGQEMFYFVPVDGRDGDSELRETGVNTAMVAEAIRNLPARRIVLIIDACQSGGAIEALSRIGSVKAQVEQRRGQQEAKTAGPGSGVGVHLIAATLPLSYAVGPLEGQSALAQTLLKALQKDSGPVTIEDVAAYVKDHLPTVSEQVTHGFRQVPLINSIGLDFSIAAKGTTSQIIPTQKINDSEYEMTKSTDIFSVLTHDMANFF